MFVAFAGQARLHQASGPFRDDDFVVRRDMVAVRMGDKGERLRVPRIEPDIFVRQINSALVLHRNHSGKLDGIAAIARTERDRAILAPAAAISAIEYSD